MVLSHLQLTKRPFISLPVHSTKTPKFCHKVEIPRKATGGASNPEIQKFTTLLKIRELVRSADATELAMTLLS
jgi:hypothetical protein